MMTTTSMTGGLVTGQMEIVALAGVAGASGRGRGRGRRGARPAPPSRARWWFSRMRQVVEATSEWTPPAAA